MINAHYTGFYINPADEYRKLQGCTDLWCNMAVTL